MILAIDIGNTFIHAGIFEGKRLIKTSKYLGSFIDKSHTILKKLTGNHTLSKVGISSVRPEDDVFFKRTITETFHLNPIFISHKVDLPINLKIKNSFQAGSDRICNAVYAYEYFKRRENVLIIDSGTAITYDVILKNSDFIGGAIAPGIDIMSKSMNQFTSKLPLLKGNKFKFPLNPVGKNTREALTSGIMYSTLHSIDGMIMRIQSYLKLDLKIILTGGNASLINHRLKHEVIVKKNCVLEGVNIILRGLNDF